MLFLFDSISKIFESVMLELVHRHQLLGDICFVLRVSEGVRTRWILHTFQLHRFPMQRKRSLQSNENTRERSDSFPAIVVRDFDQHLSNSDGEKDFDGRTDRKIDSRLNLCA